MQVLNGEDDDGSREHANYRRMELSHDRPSLVQQLEHIQFRLRLSHFRTENQFPQNALKCFNVPPSHALLFQNSSLGRLAFQVCVGLGRKTIEVHFARKPIERADAHHFIAHLSNATLTESASVISPQTSSLTVLLASSMETLLGTPICVRGHPNPP